MTYEIVRFPYDGTIDADGHVLESATLWEDYLEEKYRTRALRIRVDDAGLEYLEIDGKPSARTRDGSLGLLGAMGDATARPAPDRRYATSMPFGAGDARERVRLLDRENLAKSILYPTIGLLWECELEDPELTLAYQRAYNRWIADFCRDSGGRLVPIAHLTLLDPVGSADELERAVADGCRGAFVAPFTHSRKAHGHPDHDALYARAAALGVPLAIHPTFEPFWAAPVRFKRLGRARDFFYNVMLRQGVQQAYLSCIALGTLDRFPTLRLGVLESGAGWIGSFLDRANAVAEVGQGLPAGLTRRPSDYFREQCFISADPDETAAPWIVDHVGADCFIWATDFPHPDHPGTWARALERFVAPLSAETRAKVLGRNVARIYGL
ncbi:MAG TPA: amidohydrolase family protein [Candidatus Eisenbacteria bacterium]|nr:amidohydrolase family protein [Candidatus Eisenbacteria bacterium]